VILPKKSKWQLWVFFPKNHLFKPFLLPNYENFPCQKKKLPLHHLVLILCSCKNKLCHDQIYHQLCSLSSLFILLLLLTKLMNSFIYSNYLPWHKIWFIYVHNLFFLLGQFSQLGGNKWKIQHNFLVICSVFLPF
jgi:hypothetical protein